MPGAQARPGTRAAPQAIPGSQATPRRLFFALWPDSAFRALLQRAAEPLWSVLPGRPVAAPDWHVTLCFLGAVEEALLAPLQARAGKLRARAFVLHFDRIELWEAGRVLSANAPEVPPATVELADALHALANTLGITPDTKPLRPHVTLMRGVSVPPERAGVALDLSLAACEFHLAESALGADGSAATPMPPAPLPAAGERGQAPRRYATLAQWPLQR